MSGTSPPSTRSCSSWSFSITSGRRASSYIMKVRVEVEVSWPANISVITWSRTSRSEKPSPASSRTSSSRLSTSSRPESGLCRRCGDLAEDDLVEDLARGEHLAPGRARAAQEAQREVDPVELERALEVLGGGGALAGLVGVEAEQGAHRDPHRQAAHPLVDVDDLAAAAAARSPAPPRRSSPRPRRRPARGGRRASSSPGRGRGSRRRSSAGRRRAAGSGRRSSTRASGSSPGGRR